MPSPANCARDLRLPDFIGVGPGRTGTTRIRTFGSQFLKDVTLDTANKRII
jgi:hypothetical protein